MNPEAEEQEARMATRSVSEELENAALTVRPLLGGKEPDTPETSAAKKRYVMACDAAFQNFVTLLQSGALQQPGATDPKAVARLTLSLLSEAGGVNEGTSPHRRHLATLCGAAVEFDTSAEGHCSSEAHCRALWYQIVLPRLTRRQEATHRSADDEMEDWDENLQQLCPPLMTFFKHRLPLLRELREEPEAASAIRGLPKCMLREFLLQLVDETLLCLWVDTSKEDSGNAPRLVAAERIRFSGLSDNRALAQWATSLLAHAERPGWGYDRATQAGSNIEMDCWTAWQSVTRSGRMPGMDSPHRVWQEGIPDDIAPLGGSDGERVVLFHKGRIGRWFGDVLTFPVIPLSWERVGDPFTEDELRALQEQMELAPVAEYVAALAHQRGRGGADGPLQDLMNQAENAERERIEAR